MPLETSYEHPAPVRVIAQALSGYIARLGVVWVEGQVTELTRRPGTSTVFLTLRDPVAAVSVRVTCPRSLFDALPVPITEGARVVVQAKVSYYLERGTLSLSAADIRPVGVGELLARIEQRRQLLAAEGLFDPARKRPIPFLPSRVGLIVGRDSAAETDVLRNARRRWPDVAFRVEHCPVQGPDAARLVIEALSALDHDPAVDVVIIARGGGSIEDLLPFSDEGLVRAVAACATPVVSAIGHEQDQPLLDLVADLRASTPTDAAKRVVPDVAEERARIAGLHTRARAALERLVGQERRSLAAISSRPVLANPAAMIASQQRTVSDLLERSRRALHHRLERGLGELAARLGQLRSLSPLATLERGYAVLRTGAGSLVTDAASVGVGEQLEARLARGTLWVSVDSAAVDNTAVGRATVEEEGEA
ncbi:MAG TPA: exodeoxyribonuclease VII large subunit [Nocardioidaceae bacterium]|nr:exodeoxyribonuclease VII large subunit [Nocardioidaceae bacterium]